MLVSILKVRITDFEITVWEDVSRLKNTYKTGFIQPNF